LVRGFPDKGVIAWKGIRYAAAAEGRLRWQEPRLPASWSGTKWAKRPLGMALQRVPLTELMVGGEDCLGLNIWRPVDLSVNLPVYVWVHGGANTAGYSFPDADYNGANLARSGRMIVISIDYRLGSLGWLYDKDLTAIGSGGNLGLLDILAALSWIKNNIAAFGGDKLNITLAGESAGAADILALLCAPKAKGLFQRAIVESPLDLCSDARTAEEATKLLLSRVLVKAKRAKSIEEAQALLAGMTGDEKREFFRSRPPEDFLEGLSGGNMGMYDWPSLILDGEFLPKEGLAVFKKGKHQVKVPIIIGSNKDEVGIFLYIEGKIPPESGLYAEALAYGSAVWRARWVEDIAHDLRASRGQPPVYVYRFDWGSPDEAGESILPEYFGARVGAFHALEIPFFLGNDTVAGTLLTSLIFNPWNSSSRESLSRSIRSYTTAFARGMALEASPRDPALPAWPAYTGRAGETDLGLAFGSVGYEASVVPLKGLPSAQEEVSALEKRLGEETINEIRAKLPAFMRNAWKTK
jgi:para-nitrobenzyl esterase